MTKSETIRILREHFYDWKKRRWKFWIPMELENREKYCRWTEEDEANYRSYAIDRSEEDD